MWGSGLAPADVADLRMIPDAWNTAAAIGHIVLLDEGEEWNTHAAGEWPHTIALRGHMTAPLTPADSFDTGVVPPETGLPVAAGVVSAALQKLLNRGEWVKNRLATLTTNTTRRICWVFPTPGNVADGAVVPINLESSYAGSAESWTLSSNEVQVPVAGLYRIDASIIVGNSADLFDPAVCNVWMQVGASTFGWIVGKRFSDGDSSFHGNGHAVIPITDPATQKLKLRNGSGGMIWFDTYTPDQGKAGPVIIEYVGPVSA